MTYIFYTMVVLIGAFFVTEIVDENTYKIKIPRFN